MDVSLTARQQLFVSEYLLSLNATQAAIKAGYSPATAGQAGSRLLKNVKVRAAVNAGTAQKSEALALTSELILANITRIAENAEKVGELATALKGHELLGKHLKLFTDKLEVTGKLTLEQLVLAASKKKASP